MVSIYQAAYGLRANEVEDKSSAEHCVTIAENSVAASVGVPSAYECGEIDRGKSKLM